MIPFLVVDRPASLRIIKGANLHAPVGLMSHANTTTLFRKLFNSFPCGENPCHAINPEGNSHCEFDFDSSKCEIAQTIQRQTIKMCDCGMFTKEGVQYSYSELFQIYDEMGADFGIMLDVFRDKDATLDSARKALEIHRQKERGFKLVLVAQGETIDDYLYCYEALHELGGKYIAVGGLLQRVENTVRYVQVRDENFMYDVLKKIKEKFDPEWLFALGCYHPERHEKFEELGLWGSDYKGWIFQYKKRERLIQTYWEEIYQILVAALSSDNELLVTFKELVKTRYMSVKVDDKENHRKSTRFISLEDRSDKFITHDSKLLIHLEAIEQKIYLDGVRPYVNERRGKIRALSNQTEQQIRYQQVRELIKSLMK